MWQHTVRTPEHPEPAPIVIPWRESFQPVPTWEPEEPNTGMFYSELCNSIPNFAFHIHTLSKGREKKADIETMKLALLCRDSRAGSSEEGEQVQGAVTVFPLAFRALEELCLLDCSSFPWFWLTLHKALSWVTAEHREPSNHQRTLWQINSLKSSCSLSK